jgi:hypothetical protein
MDNFLSLKKTDRSDLPNSRLLGFTIRAHKVIKKETVTKLFITSSLKTKKAVRISNRLFYISYD